MNQPEAGANEALNQPHVLDLEEAAEFLRMPRNRVARLARKGYMPSIDLTDGELRFDRQDLLAWIALHKRPGIQGQPAA